MKLTGILAVASFGFLGFACTVATESQVGEQESTSVGEPLCANQSGVPAVMASFAVAVAKELHRWNAPVDFRWNSTTGMLELTSTGKSLCGGTCRNVQALLDLQKPEAYLQVTFPGGVSLNSYALRSVMQDGWNRQVRCNAWQGEYATNGCWVEDHRLTYNQTNPGTCAKDVFFWASKPGTTNRLDHQDRLEWQLYFAGLPGNEFLNFHETSGDIIVDPTVGLTEADATTSGSCAATCTQFSATSLIGSCCACNGVTKKFSRSPFSYDMYLCR
jgi:hypothetical protein